VSQTATDRTARASNAVSPEILKKWLYDMQLIREFETRTQQAYQQAKIGGFCHVYTGQEACAVGTIAAVEDGDPIVTAYRDHGHALAVGMHPNACMAEMFGKVTGCAKGKGGSMHMFDRSNHLYGGHGIVGAQTPLGAGLAFAARYEWEVMGTGAKRVCLCYLGDGALNQGAFHEAQNLAGLFGLPVIFIVENNGYSMGTSIARGTTMPEDLVLKSSGYGIKGIELDGFDMLHVYDVMKPLVDECREEQRPAFVDLKTYRYYGHSMSDPQKYRTKDEVEEFKGKDSIAKLASDLMERGVLTEDDWQTMQAEIKDICKASLAFAEKSDEPAPDELYTDVYANPEPQLSPMGSYRHGLRNPLISAE